MKKPNIHVAKYLKNKPLAIGAGLIIGSLTYTTLFTDAFICHGCVVNENGIKIKQGELDDSLKLRQNFYAYSIQSADIESLKSDALKELSNKKRVQKYANEKGIEVSGKEIDSLYQQRVRVEGSEMQLLDKVKKMYGLNKSEYRDVLKIDLLNEKVQYSLGTPLADWLSK